MPVTDKMPTMAKFAAAISLAILGYHAGQVVKPLLPEHTAFGHFDKVNVVLGLLVGWVVIGKRVGRTYVESFSAGLTGMAALVFWVIFAQSANEMLALALKRRFDGPMEAIVGIFEIGVEYAQYLSEPKLIFVLLLGGITAGILAEWTSRRWS